jgi:hypothetical protein
MSILKQIQLYTELGAETEYYLTITSTHKYYITKMVACSDSRYSDKTKYKSIVIQCVEDPFNIVINNTRLCIETEHLDCFIQNRPGSGCP